MLVTCIWHTFHNRSLKPYYWSKCKSERLAVCPFVDDSDWRITGQTWHEISSMPFTMLLTPGNVSTFKYVLNPPPPPPATYLTADTFVALPFSGPSTETLSPLSSQVPPPNKPLFLHSLTSRRMRCPSFLQTAVLLLVHWTLFQLPFYRSSPLPLWKQPPGLSPISLGSRSVCNG